MEAETEIASGNGDVPEQKKTVCIIFFSPLLLFEYPFAHTHTQSERRTTNYSKFVENVCVLLWPPLLPLLLLLLRCNSILQSESESESEHAEVNVLPDSYNSFQGDNKSKINKSQESCEQEGEGEYTQMKSLPG